MICQFLQTFNLLVQFSEYNSGDSMGWNQMCSRDGMVFFYEKVWCCSTIAKALLLIYFVIYKSNSLVQSSPIINNNYPPDGVIAAVAALNSPVSVYNVYMLELSIQGYIADLHPGVKCVRNIIQMDVEWSESHQVMTPMAVCGIHRSEWHMLCSLDTK